MPRALWSGSISFGLVNIPVKLYVAVRDKTVRFHKLHGSDGVRLRQKMVCPADGDEIPDEETVRGYEISPDWYVVVKQEEMDALAPKATHAIEILDFVALDQIDPVYYQRPYYLFPEEQGLKAYTLLVRAMSEMRKVGIGKLVMHNKEYLVVLRPIDEIICLETMHFADEVLSVAQFEEPLEPVEVDDRELEMARQLIETLTSDFEPSKYHDEYRESLLELINKKAEGEEVITPPPVEEEPGKVVDLMSALEESLSKAREGKKKKRSSG